MSITDFPRILLLCVAITLPATAGAQAAAPTRAPAFATGQLAAAPTTGWLTNGGNYANQRYSPLTAINRDNVAGLRAVWRTHLNGSGNGAQYSGQGQPIVHDGTIYVSTGADDVFAIDVATGALRWTYEAKLDSNRVKVCCGWVNRGVSIGDGKVFIGQLDAKLVALDQRTGKVVWSIQGEDPLKGYSLVAAPLYFDGLLIIGYAGGDMGIRGRVKGYDARTGALRWTFYTIPGPGEPGHETWPADSDIWKYGGAPVWQTPALDPELGLIYFTTGNAAPDYNGSVRKGDNLYTASMLAIEARTGKYRWHFQQVHHDIWDYDSPSPVVLFEAPYQGVMRKGIAQASKTGWVYILDRETGKPLIGIEERPVPQEPRQHTAATQPYPVGDSVVPQSIDIAPEGFELVNQGRIFTPFWDKVVLYKPQMGVNWPPSSHDPATNLLYVCGLDHVASSVSDQKGFTEPTFQGMYFGGGGANPGVARRGIFSAIDLKTNRLAWQQQWSDGCWSGSLATKGGLVFVGRNDGRLTALDSSNGRRLWQFQTDAGVNAPASSFEHGGRQYVVVMSAGSMFSGGRKGDSIWLFALDGTMEPLPPPTAGPGAATGGIELPAGTPDLARGKGLYTQYCLACHGDTGLGGHGGGASLANASRDLATMANTAYSGRNAMPPFRGILVPDQLRDIVHYIANDLLKERKP
jgi:alcohol dehydrogenase (cytochrome c)